MAKPTPIKSTLPVSDDELDIDLDLDAEERPEADRIRPFRTKIADKVLSFSDPAELDWQDLLLAGDNPTALFRLVLSEEDREHLADASLPSWKLGRLVKAFLKHYRMEEKLAQEQRRRGLL